MTGLTTREKYIALTAWEAGRAYGHAEISDAIEAARAVPVKRPVPRSWEEQVAARLADFDRLAQDYYRRTGRREWRGTLAAGRGSP